MPARTAEVLSGSPPPSIVAYDSCTVPPSARITAHALPSSRAPMRIGVDAVPSPTRAPCVETVTVAFGAMRTIAQGSSVTLAVSSMSNGTMCGLVSAVHVSSAVTLRWVVGPAVGAGHADGTVPPPSGVGEIPASGAGLTELVVQPKAASGKATKSEWDKRMIALPARSEPIRIRDDPWERCRD